MSRRQKIALIFLLFIVVVCVGACTVAWIYQERCMFEVEPPTTVVSAGSEAHFTLLQWDCLLAYLGFHACYETPSVQIKGLPPGSVVRSIEWLGCHESEMIIATQPDTPAGVYRLAIKREGSRTLPDHATLKIVAP